MDDHDAAVDEEEDDDEDEVLVEEDPMQATVSISEVSQRFDKLRILLIKRRPPAVFLFRKEAKMRLTKKKTNR